MGANNGTYVGSPTLGMLGLLTGDLDAAVTFAAGKYVSVAQQVLPAAITRYCRMGESNILGGLGDPGPKWASSVGIMLYCDGAHLSTCSAGATQPSRSQCLRPERRTFSSSPRTRLGTGRSTSTACRGGQLSLPAISSPAVPFEIGTYSNHAGGQFNGTIDETTYWNRALSAAEITALYRIGSGT